MTLKGFFDVSLHQTINQWLTVPLLLLLGTCLFMYFMIAKAQDKLESYLAPTLSIETTRTR